MRNAGLSIGDAAKLRWDRLDPDGDLTLRHTKNGGLVAVALPFAAVSALEEIASPADSTSSGPASRSPPRLRNTGTAA